MASQKFDRRRFLCRAGAFSLASVAGLATFAGCGGNEEAATPAAQPQSAGGQAVKAAAEAADPCHDVASLTEAERVTRTTFKYEPKALDETKLCNTCNFWEPAPAGELCGGCTLVKGPIHPLGSCMSWVEKIKT